LLYKSQFSNQIEALTLSATAIAVAVAGGALLGLGNLDLGLILLVSLAGLVALLHPVASLYLLIIAGLVVVGLLRLYVPGFEKVQWGVAGLATVLGAIGILGYLFKPQPGYDMPPNSGTLCVLLLFIVGTSVINLQTPAQALYGLKGYAQVIGLFFAITLLQIPNRVLNTLPKMLVVIAVIQLPFVLQQYFVLVPQRVNIGSGIVAEDVVAGTMGASLGGGGSNAILSILLIIAIAIVAAGYKRGQLRPWKCAIIAIVCAIPLFLNANRSAALYLLVVFAVVFGPSMFRRASRFFAGALLTAIIIAGSVWVNVNYSSRSDEYSTWQEFVVTSIERNTAPEIGYGSFELNRLGSLTFWWTEQFRRPDLKRFLFGNGPGAAREATDSTLPVKTLASARYSGVGIGLTGISSILWELGIVGLAVVLALHFNAYRSAQILVSHLRTNPFRQYVAEGLKTAVIIFVLCLFHRNSFVFHLTYQTLVYMVFGILSVWHFQLYRTDARSRAGTLRPDL
jgi:hypothetical protein